MKILEVNKFFYPRRGAERHFLDLVRLLESHGHSVAIFSMEHPENLFSPYSGFFPSYVGFNADDSTMLQRIKGILRLWSFESYRKMERLLKEFHPDIVHVHNIYHQLSPSILLAAKRRNIPIVMTVHDYNIVSPDKDRSLRYFRGKLSNFLFDRRYLFLKRMALFVKFFIEREFRLYDRFVSIYIAPSKYVMNALVDFGIHRDKIFVLPHFLVGADSFDTKEGSSVSRAPVLNAGGKGILPNSYALCIGAVSEEKGINELVRIFEKVQFPLIVAGSAECGFDPIRSQWVSFVGKKTKFEVWKLIQNARFVISGSQLEETFGLVALESFSLGKPFFGLAVGAYPEIVRQGINGCLGETYFELQENIKKYLSGELVLASGEEIIRHTKEMYDSSKYEADLLKIFEYVGNSALKTAM